MPEQYIFEYAVVRVVPCVEREEFINVGVVVYCQRQKFLQTKITLNKDRLCAFKNTFDLAELTHYLAVFEQICNGNASAGPIAQLELASRFRWLTAARSTIVQMSRIHPGLCSDPAETLLRLHQQLVL